MQLLSIPGHLPGDGGHPVAFGLQLVRGRVRVKPCQRILCRWGWPDQLGHVYGSTSPTAGKVQDLWFRAGL